MASEIDITTEQYYAGIDKLWAALNTDMWQRDNVAGDIASTGHDVFTLVAKRIAQLECTTKILENKLNKISLVCGRIFSEYEDLKKNDKELANE